MSTIEDCGNLARTPDHRIRERKIVARYITLRTIFCNFSRSQIVFAFRGRANLCRLRAVTLVSFFFFFFSLKLGNQRYLRERRKIHTSISLSMRARAQTHVNAKARTYLRHHSRAK